MFILIVAFHLEIYILCLKRPWLPEGHKFWANLKTLFVMLNNVSVSVINVKYVFQKIQCSKVTILCYLAGFKYWKFELTRAFLGWIFVSFHVIGCLFRMSWLVMTYKPKYFRSFMTVLVSKWFKTNLFSNNTNMFMFGNCLFYSCLTPLAGCGNIE